MLALRAGEAGAAPRAVASPAAFTTSAHLDDGALLTVLAALQPPPAAAAVTPAQEARVKESFGKLPLYFEQNVGQTDAAVHFFTHGPGYGLFLTSTEAVMVLDPPKAANDMGQVANLPGDEEAGWQPAPHPETPPAVVRMQVLGGNPAPAVAGRVQQPGIVNYFLGNDPAKWRTNVATYARVEYDEVYPGIDLVYYGHQRQLEYDFVVAPGADPSVIRLSFTGAERVEIDGAGDLVLHASGQELRQHKPFVYQEAAGQRQEVAAGFVVQGSEVHFALGCYDKGAPLVIDPVLSYSTYLGGSAGDNGGGIAVDDAGNAYVSGRAVSFDFPTTPEAYQPTLRGEQNGFVAKLNADGSALVYASYLGGKARDLTYGIGVDWEGNVYVTGWTDSTDFPTVNAVQPIYGGGFLDAFVTKLNAAGSDLVYSTFLGGSDRDQGFRLAVDPNTGHAYVTGRTASSDFPTANAFQPKHGGGICYGGIPCADAFVAQLAADGSALVYSTYLGSSDFDMGLGIAVDAAGDGYVTGVTYSTNFPTVNPLQPTIRGGADAFVAQITATGSALVYSTYLGGSRDENSWGGGGDIAVDAAGDAYVVGTTESRDFPTRNPFQPAFGGAESDAFVAKIQAGGSTLVYSSYLGGGGGMGIPDENASGIAVDVAGHAYVTGRTASRDFPTANAFQPTLGGIWDVYITKVHPTGSALVYSTFLGGSNDDYGADIAVDWNTGAAFVTGATTSTNFPTANPLQPDFGGLQDAFVARIGAARVVSFYLSPDSGAVTAGTPFDLYVFALDANYNIIPDYTGEIFFWSTDPKATTPEPYTFRLADQGVAYFPRGVTLRTLGVHELFVFDTATYEVFGYAVFEVA